MAIIACFFFGSVLSVGTVLAILVINKLDDCANARIRNGNR